MFPEGAGGMAYLMYDYQDQDHNWSGSSRGAAANNGDKEIRTDFFALGLQYMFSSSWGLQVEVPIDNRSFKTTGGASGNDIVSLDWTALGDIRVEGIYTGFSPDLSTGVTFGFKLPTGDYTHNDAYNDVDRDSELGTGSLDVLLGAFHRQHLTRDGKWNWYTQALLDAPIVPRSGYTPGIEIDAAAGIYYQGFSLGGVGITPVAQVIASERTHDQGIYAAGGIDDPPQGQTDSGYQRILLSPGVELDFHRLKVYADVEIPVYEYFTGNQLVAPALFKLSISYMF